MGDPGPDDRKRRAPTFGRNRPSLVSRVAMSNERTKRERLTRPCSALLAGVVLSALALAGCSRHATQPVPVQGRQTPSGQPVPRYVSLKFDKVNARAGPGDDYDLKWIYRVKGLPLQVVAETDEWRRVCDAQGAMSWVHRRTTDGRRTVMRTQAVALVLHARPDETSPEAATLVGRSLAELKDCQGDWCRVAVGRAQGWLRSDEVWGLAPAPQCR
jgi:SH3-like domain-containing protein